MMSTLLNSLNVLLGHPTRQRVMLVLLTLLLVLPAAACPVCFGDKDSRTTQAAAQSIFVLLGCTVGVLGSLVAFALRMHRFHRTYNAAPPSD